MKIALLLATVASASATASVSTRGASAAFRKLHSRKLENEEADEADAADEADDMDFSFLSGYNVMYTNCFHSNSVVTYKLCPSDDTCQAKCASGTSHLIDFYEFIDLFTEMQMEAKQYRCEYVRENCEYDNDDENAALEACYAAAGINYDCDNWNENEGFNLQEWIEGCKEVDGTGYYVAPYCAEDNYSINLGVFTDADCTIKADSTDIFTETFGFELPYSSESILPNECGNCKEHGKDEDKEDGDVEDEDDVLEQCEVLYGDATGHCDAYDQTACDVIKKLQNDERVTEGSGIKRKQHGLIWFLAILLLVLIGVTGYAYYKKSQARKNSSGDDAYVLAS